MEAFYPSGSEPKREGKITAAQLSEWIELGPAPLILDVREPWEFEAGHAPHALSAPASNAAALVRWVPDDGLVVLMCTDGILSRHVARMLECCGLRHVLWLEGGIGAWREIAHHPRTRGN